MGFFGKKETILVLFESVLYYIAYENTMNITKLTTIESIVP
jgi:hypothetical protein